MQSLKIRLPAWSGSWKSAYDVKNEVKDIKLYEYLDMKGEWFC